MLLDASIFSRAIISVGIQNIRKYLVQEEKEIIVGKATSLTGDFLKYSKIKIITAKKTLDNGSIVEINDGEKGLIKARVAAGITFKELINYTSNNGIYPALFPIYLEGTVGGFIATNGSGFGSYKFGFVNNKKIIHYLENKDLAIMTFVRYDELIETNYETSYAWTAIVSEDRVTYYTPSLYKPLFERKEGGYSIIDTKNVILQLNDRIEKILKSKGIPISLRIPKIKYQEIISKLDIQPQIGFIIRFNSPDMYYVIFSTIEPQKLPLIFKLLKSNPDIYPYPSLKEYETIHKSLINIFDKYEIKTPKDISKEVYLEALNCINCGKCLDVCLAYKTTGNIFFSPLGRFNRIITGDRTFEYCLGCKNCEEVCPQEIKIAKVMEELPRLSPSKIRLEVKSLPITLKNEIEKALDSNYRNQPLVILFIGCSYKYDMEGVENFLKFSIEAGDKVKYPLRMKIVDGKCCGFDDYISGNIREAEMKVNDIKKLKEELGAQYVYFLCPEALYVYNSLSGDRGILVYEIIKDEVKGKKIHAGCWSRKLGIYGDDFECAGIFLSTYAGKPMPISRRNDILTICPFSTWKFGTKSIYSSLKVSGTEYLSQSTVLEQSKFFIDKLLLLSFESYKESIKNSADEIAEKVIMWGMGGKGYFVLLSLPIVRKNFSNILRSKLLEQGKDFMKAVTSSERNILEIGQRIFEYLRSIDYTDIALNLQNLIKNSKRLDYSAKQIVESEEFLNTIKEELIKKALSLNLIVEILRNTAVSSL
jgi:ferredoxin